MTDLLSTRATIVQLLSNMTDAEFDSENCIAYEEAENRLHVQKAIMKVLVR